MLNLATNFVAEQTTQANGMSSLASIGILVLFVVIMYFLMIRPQKKREKEEAKMRNSIEIGDEILTIGGIYGRVVSLKEDSLIIESSGDRSKLRITRSAVSQNLTVHDTPAPVKEEKATAKKAEKEEKKEKQDKQEKEDK
ncbi:MAG: preprotein translocase subunit YajC [Acutalibacteraceae bacterium]|nr:preprotein translocase subunit YajC [Acutalibacteraceae bacterium]